MPKSKRASHFLTLQCCMCPIEFKARREDKKTCSVKCRKALSRAHAGAVAERDLAKILRPKGKLSCYGCGMSRDGRVVVCPICGERKTKKVR